MTSVRGLIVLVVALAGIGFIAGIVSAIRYSLKGTPEKMPRALQQVITLIGGVLATNFGAVVGIKVEQSTTNGFAAATLNPLVGDAVSGLQLGAAWLYFIGLLIACAGWWRLNFTEEPGAVVASLPQLSQTLIGVGGGIVAVALGST